MIELKKGINVGFIVIGLQFALAFCGGKAFSENLKIDVDDIFKKRNDEDIEKIIGLM